MVEKVGKRDRELKRGKTKVVKKKMQNKCDKQKDVMMYVGAIYR